MASFLITIYTIVSIFLGIGPAIIFAIWKFGLKRQLWLAWGLGGLFWLLALAVRIVPLNLIALTVNNAFFQVFIGALFAGIFETVFRVMVLLLLSKYTANSSEKVYMTGLGWGTEEAFVIHSLSLISILFLPEGSETLLQLEGVEYALLFGGFERIIAEILHVNVLILTFYGIKQYIKQNEQSKPLIENFYTRDPSPIWLWVIFAVAIHFAFDFMLVSLIFYVDIITDYLIGAVFAGVLTVYTTNRIKFYPLFPKNTEKLNN